MKPPISGRTVVAGVAGHPVSHSLSPLLHNAWLAATETDGVYVAFDPGENGFSRFVEGLRGGSVRGINVTAPFKAQARTLADTVSDAADAAGTANLLTFEADGTIRADNTDGMGLIYALSSQAPEYDPASGPVVILGAGGAARGAAAALAREGAPEVRIVNRTYERAQATAAAVGRPARALSWEDGRAALRDAALVINATSAELGGTGVLGAPIEAAPKGAVALDMVYRPLRTPFLDRAAARGMTTVDGLAMLIGQAIPSFATLFGLSPPAELAVRALAVAALEDEVPC